MPDYPYRIVDVFTRAPLRGNPLAVFTHAAGMSDATMQELAKEMNLSETTFVVQPKRSGCAAGVRIFTPTKEMVFAGHPTVGTSYVLLAEGLVPPESTNFALDEKVGAVPVRVEQGEGGAPLIWLKTPPISDGPFYEREACARALGLKTEQLLDVRPQMLSAGNPTIFVALRDKAAVDAASTSMEAARSLRRAGSEPECIFLFTPTRDGAYSRMFAPEYGIVEDAATGSSTGPLALYMMRHRLVAQDRFVSEQGVKMGRRSLLHIRVQGEMGSAAIEVGGYVYPLAKGVITIP